MICISSAKDVAMACSGSLFMSVTIIRNNIGPNTEPCEILLMTLLASDKLLQIVTFVSCPRGGCVPSFPQIPSKSIPMSKAFAKSI